MQRLIFNLLLLFFIYSPCVFSEEIKGLINQPDTQVRTEASDSAKMVVQLDVGTRVEVIERTGDWYKIAVANTDKVGWIKKSQLMEFTQWIAFNNKPEEAVPPAVSAESIIFTKFLILPMANNDKYKNAGMIYQSLLDTLIANGRFKIMSTNVAFNIEKQFKTKENLSMNSDILKKIAAQEQVDGIINGKISKIDSKKGVKWEVVMHVYQAHEGVLHSIEKTVIYEADDDPKKVIQDLIIEMINRLPYFAVVEKVTDDHITINQGKNVKLVHHDKLPIFRVTNITRDPRNDTFIRCDTVEIGTLRINMVFDRTAEGILEGKIEDARTGFLAGAPQKVFIPSP